MTRIKKLQKISIIATIFLLIYTIFLVWRMFFYSYSGYVRVTYEEMQYNIIPFRTISQYLFNIDKIKLNILIYNILGNIVVFIPISFLLPLVLKKYDRKYILSISFITIFTAESMQLITKRGVFDIDDFFLNMIGCIIGFTISKFLSKYLIGGEK